MVAAGGLYGGEKVTAWFLLFGGILGWMGARVEMWKVAPRGGGIIGALLVSQIGIHSGLGIRRLIVIGVLCAILAELVHRFRPLSWLRRQSQNGTLLHFRRCAWCGRIIWPGQTWVCRVGTGAAFYHNTTRHNCFALKSSGQAPRSDL
jgi:hypothetical protein